MDLVVQDSDSFAFEQLLHQFGTLEMVFSGQQALAIDNPVGRDGFVQVRGVQGPADHGEFQGTAQWPRRW